MAKVPKKLLYTEQHEWLLMEDDLGSVGITDYAQTELGDIVFVELPQIGDRFEKEQPFGAVEAVKTVADLFAPVSGEIVEVNESLEADAAQVNQDPYISGWMIRMRLDNPEEVNEMMTPGEYEEMIKGL